MHVTIKLDEGLSQGVVIMAISRALVAAESEILVDHDHDIPLIVNNQRVGTLFSRGEDGA